jgi:hypothetical protein
MATGDKVYLRIVTRAHALSTSEPRTKPIYNVWDFRRNTTGGTPSKSNAYTAFLAAVMVPLKACLSVSYVTDYADYRWLDDPLDPYFTVALAQTGTVAGDSVPSLNNAYLKLVTGVRGPSNRGAKHLGPIAESSTTLDQLNAGAITLFGTFATSYIAGFTGADGFVYQPFLTSQIQSTFTLKPPTANVVGRVVTSTVLNTVIGRMERRAQYRRGSV